MTTKWRERFSIISLVMILLHITFVVSPIASAQQDTEVEWDPPVNLSNSLGDSTRPAIATDHWGQVHVFWSERVGASALREGEGLRPGNAIYYTRWDRTFWTRPVDIFFLAEEVFADLAVAADSDGALHLVWIGRQGVLYSRSQALAPVSAKSWQPVQLIAKADLVDQVELVIGPSDQIYVVYNRLDGVGGSLFFMKSEDLGATWDTSQLPYAVSVAGARFAYRPKIALDAAGRLHLTWLEYTGPPEFQGLALQYARSEDGGETWSTPFNLSEGLVRPEEQVSESAPLAIGRDTLLVVYIQGEFTFRYYRYSTDGGLTWSAPRRIFGQLRSRAGWDAIAVDGVGMAHLVAQLRVPYAIYTSSWDGRVWDDPPRAVLTEAPLNEGHYPQMAVSEGNKLHVVLADIVNGEIWYMRGTTQAPEMPALPVPTPTISSPEPTPLQLEVMENTDASEGLDFRFQSATGLEPSAETASSPAATIPVGVVLAGLLCGITILVRYIRIARR